MRVTAADIASAIQRHVYRFSSEAVLQDGIAIALDYAGVQYVCEHSFAPRDRIDFWIPSIGLGIEVKIDGSANAVARQIHRYCRYDEVKGIILATTRRKHASVPGVLNQKPVFISLVSERSL